MDKWQQHVYDKVSAFLSNEFEYRENEVSISMNQREAYIVMKALESIEPETDIPDTGAKP